jgi:hypothetical protein
VLWFHIICCFVVISTIFPYFVAITMLFSALFLFSANIIDLVPYKWYQSTFLGIKLWVNFFQGRDVFRRLKATEICRYAHKLMVRE